MGSGDVKQMQIRKPLLKSSLADPNMTEDEVNMKYVQDLLNWVEEMQVSAFLKIDTVFNYFAGPSAKNLYFKHAFLRSKAAARSFRVGLGFAQCGNVFG